MPDSGEQLSRLVQREAQIGGPHLGELAGEAQAMQPKLRVAASQQHDPEQRRPASEQEFELRERLWRVQLVQIVDDEHDRLFQRAELREETLDDRFPVELRRRRQLLDERIGAGGAAQLLDDREPEPLGISLVPLDGDPRDPVGKSRIIDPRAKQDCLAAAGGRRHECDSRRTAGREALKQPSPRDGRRPASAA